MLFIFAFLAVSCCCSSAVASLRQSSFAITTPTRQDAAPTSSSSNSLRPSNSDIHIELRALPKQLTATLSTLYTTTPVAPLQARADLTLAPEMIGYTSTQGVFSAFNCHDNGTYTSVSGYARCCTQAQTDCPIYTQCTDTSSLKNDQYGMNCTGSGSQTVCVTGTIYESIGDTNPRLYVGCWPSWSGGDWKATRTVPDDDNRSGGGGPPTGGALAGITIGAILGLGILVAIGVFAAKFYTKLKKTLVVLEGQAKAPEQRGRPGGTDKEVGAQSEETVIWPPKVRPSFVGNALFVKKPSLRHDSAGTISNASVYDARHVRPGRVSGSSQDDIQEVCAGQYEHPQELDVRQPGVSRNPEGERVTTPYVDAQENVV